MGMMDTMMDAMIKSMSKEKKEQMMINMMPLMMEGINVTDLMPKMMTNMLQDATVDDVIGFMKKMLEDKQKIADMLDKLKQANVMKQMMFKVYRSKLASMKRWRRSRIGRRETAGRFLRLEICRKPTGKRA